MLSTNFLPNRSTSTPIASPKPNSRGENATEKYSKKISLPEGPAGRRLQMAAAWTQGFGLPSPHTLPRGAQISFRATASLPTEYSRPLSQKPVSRGSGLFS